MFVELLGEIVVEFGEFLFQRPEKGCIVAGGAFHFIAYNALHGDLHGVQREEEVQEKLIGFTSIQFVLRHDQRFGTVSEEVQRVAIQVVGGVRVITGIDVNQWNDTRGEIQIVGEIPGMHRRIEVHHELLMGQTRWSSERGNRRVLALCTVMMMETILETSVIVLRCLNERRLTERKNLFAIRIGRAHVSEDILDVTSVDFKDHGVVRLNSTLNRRGHRSQGQFRVEHRLRRGTCR